jgi:hypothetical protein
VQNWRQHSPTNVSNDVAAINEAVDVVLKDNIGSLARAFYAAPGLPDECHETDFRIHDSVHMFWVICQLRDL